MKEEEILGILPLHIRTIIKQADINWDELQEIRLRIQKPVILKYNAKTCYLSEQGKITTRNLPSGASILDFGCGSGRDTKYFLKRNYNVTAIDGSEEICKEASKYTGIKVKQMLFEELNDQNIYDGIWACASILHLSKNDLFLVFHKMNKALKENGIIYTSFKYGEFEGERNGRYFTDFTEDSLKEFILQIPQLQIKEIWTTGDVREGRGDERWLNILICKGKIS